VSGTGPAIVDRMLGCGHTVRAAAWKTIEELRCPFLCDLTLDEEAALPVDRAAVEAAKDRRAATRARTLSRRELAEDQAARVADQQETIARHRARGEER
jgi:hypothetical protein